MVGFILELIVILAEIFTWKSVAEYGKTEEERIDYKIKALKKEEWFLKIYEEYTYLFEKSPKMRGFISRTDLKKLKKDRTKKQDFEIQLGFLIKELVSK